MLAAARKHQRVVQVGTQRRSTPHIIEARDRFIREGKLGKIGLVEMCCYYHMRATENPPDTDPPPYLDYEMWTGPAPMRPYNRLVHPRGWRAFMEYGNGIVGDMCIHMFDMVRWMLGLGWPKRVSSEGGILVDKQSKANISDTQTATFDYDDLKIVWQHRTWGAAPDPDPNYAWSSTFYGDKGTLKVSVYSYDFRAGRRQGRGASRCHLRVRTVSDRQDRAGPGKACGAGHPVSHEGFSGGHRCAVEARGGYRRRIHLDDELHPGESVDEAGPDAGLGSASRAHRGR